MELTAFFKSVIDQDDQPVVICDTAHTILYMNPTAIRRYEKRGGVALVGQNLMACHNAHSAAAFTRWIECTGSPWFRGLLQFICCRAR